MHRGDAHQHGARGETVGRPRGEHVGPEHRDQHDDQPAAAEVEPGAPERACERARHGADRLGQQQIGVRRRQRYQQRGYEQAGDADGARAVTQGRPTGLDCARAKLDGAGVSGAERTVDAHRSKDARMDICFTLGDGVAGGCR